MHEPQVIDLGGSNALTLRLSQDADRISIALEPVDQYFTRQQVQVIVANLMTALEKMK